MDGGGESDDEGADLPNGTVYSRLLAQEDEDNVSYNSTDIHGRSRSAPLGDSRMCSPVNASMSYHTCSSSTDNIHKSCPNLNKRRKSLALLYYKRAFRTSVSESRNIHRIQRTVSGSYNYDSLRSRSASFTVNQIVSVSDIDSESNCESSEETGTSRPGFFRSLDRRQCFILLSLSLSDFSCYVCLSLLSPFFPLEANLRGISTETTGWIFGVFALVQVIASPIAGKMMNSTGARFMFLAGLFFAAGCNALFGALDWVSDGDGGLVFIVLCFTIRVFLALGCTAYTTASFALCATEFDDNVTTVFGILETVIGLGMMVGPALGGVLYEAGGFCLPFLVTGGFMMAIVPVTFFLLPRHDEFNNEESKDVQPLLLFKSPALYVVCVDVIVSAILWSVLDPLLEPHLETFNLSTDLVGLLFLLMSGVYALLSPVWGWVADHMIDSKPLLMIGFLLSGVGLCLLGPSPLLGLGNYNELWLNIVSLIVLGASISLASVPTFDVIICIAEDAGLPDNLGTYALIAGVWSSAFSMGDFVGPSFGGILQASIGFSWTVTCVAFLSVAAGFLTLVLYLVERFVRQRNKSGCPLAESTVKDIEEISGETSPLLGETRDCGEVHEVMFSERRANGTSDLQTC